MNTLSNYLRNTSELNQRVVMGIVMIVMIGVPILLGGALFLSILFCLCVLVTSEYVSIVRSPKASILLFITLEFIGFYLMRESAFGFHKVLLLVFSVASFDTIAYFTGKAIGKHKLCPTISPGKTIEGFIGGVLITLILSIPIYHLLKCKLSFILYFGVIVILTILTQLGDIIESKFKRQYGVKDSSTLIPGHGGVLDRFDGYILALPAFFAITMAFKLFNIPIF